MEKEIQFVGYLFLYKRIVGAEQFKEVYNDLLTCSNSMDKVYIFNYSGCDQSVLYDYYHQNYPINLYAFSSIVKSINSSGFSFVSDKVSRYS